MMHFWKMMQIGLVGNIGPCVHMYVYVRILAWGFNLVLSFSIVIPSTHRLPSKGGPYTTLRSSEMVYNLPSLQRWELERTIVLSVVETMVRGLTECLHSLDLACQVPQVSLDQRLRVYTGARMWCG